MAVTGLVDPDRLHAQRRRPAPGTPLTLTKPLGIGVLNSRHKATGEVFGRGGRGDDRRSTGTPRAAAVAAGVRAATDVTGFGLLGHLLQAGPGQRGHRGGRRRRGARTWTAPGRRWPTGYVSGGTRRNLDWVRPHADLDAVGEDEALLLADAQTSGGLLLAGEIPGHPVIGELVPRRAALVEVR